MVSWGGDKVGWVPPNYTFNPGRQFSWDTGSGTISILNINGNSGNILSKPVKICFLYA
jgi:hypothetical protein